MTQEEKSLLLKDLCARLPYGVVVSKKPINESFTWKELQDFQDGKIYKPYLRPMSSMTEEEKEEFSRLKRFSITVVMPNGGSILKPSYIVDLEDDGDGLNYLYDWLNKKMFDYRGLIGKTLALEAPKDMYNN